MYFDKDSWLNLIQETTKIFIESNYCEELPLFDTFWQVFSARINEVIQSGEADSLTISPMSQVITQISFARGYSQDFITPIVTLTTAEVLHALMTKNISASELENLIHSSATRHGAKPSLTACLIHSLPSLCNDILICKDNNSTEAIISEAPRPSQYRIWTEGKYIISDSIEKYEKDKDKYLLWIDMNAKQHVSSKKPKATLDPRAVRLIQYLVEHLGVTLSIENVINHVYKGDISLTFEHNIGKIAQHVTQLNNFCGGRRAFDSYLSSKWRQDGLYLREDFKDKYFLFKRATPDLD